MGVSGSPGCGLLCWLIPAVDGNQTLVVLVGGCRAKPWFKQKPFSYSLSLSVMTKSNPLDKAKNKTYKHKNSNKLDMRFSVLLALIQACTD